MAIALVAIVPVVTARAGIVHMTIAMVIVHMAIVRMVNITARMITANGLSNSIETRTTITSKQLNHSRTKYRLSPSSEGDSFCLRKKTEKKRAKRTLNELHRRLKVLPHSFKSAYSFCMHNAGH
ncbi:hypothetical protein [Paenibacillus sp. Leaf72]|uniref:hypothetical protein n=1 Tax=Paenibacillus sp. Leaf72 TaxID=1736234 RepID=UPI0012DF45FC|nr:hypothetical protein [Paenibacillus sp. Leaf72]